MQFSDKSPSVCLKNLPPSYSIVNKLESFMRKSVLFRVYALAIVLNANSSHAYDESPWCARFGGVVIIMRIAI